MSVSIRTTEIVSKTKGYTREGDKDCDGNVQLYRGVG
jgi:hypothetical protein